jgi:hypothetical protein
MCIMEVRAGQHGSTIAQAMAHNTSTVERDLDMFEELLKSRQKAGDTDSGALLVDVVQAHTHLRLAYATLLRSFGEEIGREVQDTHGHAHDHDTIGSERTLTEQAHHDATLARRYETR